jgi:hypothetical protein
MRSGQTKKRFHLKFNASKDDPFMSLAKDGFIDGYAGGPNLDPSTWVGDG